MRALTWHCCLALLFAISCTEEVKFCDMNPPACKLISADPQTAFIGQIWDVRVTFPPELDIEIAPLNYLPMTLGQQSNGVLVRIDQDGRPSPPIAIDNSFLPGTACFGIDKSYSDSLYFGEIPITIKGNLSFSAPIVYTDPDNSPPPDGQYPWPVWVGALPSLTKGMPGQVVIWNDGNNSDLSDREIKRLDPSFTTSTRGVPSLNSSSAFTGSPRLAATPAVSIAYGKIFVAYPYNSMTSSLAVRACAPTQTNLLMCNQLVTTLPDLFPPNIGMYFGELGSKILLVYADQTGLTKSNLFDASTTTLSDKDSISAPQTLQGTWSQVFFGKGFFSTKNTPELLVVYRGNSANAASLYTLDPQNGSLAVSTSNLATTLQKTLSNPLQAVAFGDLDGDGWTDLAVASQKSVGVNTISLFINQGNGTFLTEEGTVGDISSMTPITSLAIGDVGGDSQADVMATVAADKQVYIYLNQTPPTTPSTPCP